MHDYIFSAELDTFLTSPRPSGHYYTKANGGKANLAGMELDCSPVFFLPSFLSGFGINGNYIYTYSNTLLPELNQYSPLPGQIKHVPAMPLCFTKNTGFPGGWPLTIRAIALPKLINFRSPLRQRLRG